MASFWDRINPLGKKSWVNPIANKSFRNAAMDFLTGTPEKRENVSTLREEQEPLYNQAINAGMGRGAGGAFGSAADYYYNNLSDNPADFDKFAAPALRQYNEDIVPGLSEQFAGMGAGGLSSSGFRNAQIQGATDLSERLGALRAQLRQNSAQGLQNIGQTGLQNYSQNMVTEQGSPGFLGTIAPVIGSIAGSYFGGPAGGAAGNAAGNAVGNAASNVLRQSANTGGGGENPSNGPYSWGGTTLNASPNISGNRTGMNSGAYGSQNLNTWGGNKVGANTSPYGWGKS